MSDIERQFEIRVTHPCITAERFVYFRNNGNIPRVPYWPSLTTMHVARKDDWIYVGSPDLPFEVRNLIPAMNKPAALFIQVRLGTCITPIIICIVFSTEYYTPDEAILELFLFKEKNIQIANRFFAVILAHPDYNNFHLDPLPRSLTIIVHLNSYPFATSFFHTHSAALDYNNTVFSNMLLAIASKMHDTSSGDTPECLALRQAANYFDRNYRVLFSPGTGDRPSIDGLREWAVSNFAVRPVAFKRLGFQFVKESDMREHDPLEKTILSAAGIRFGNSREPPRKQIKFISVAVVTDDNRKFIKEFIPFPDSDDEETEGEEEKEEGEI